MFSPELQVQLSSIEANLKYFRSISNPETEVGVVVKCYAYGLGLKKIVKFIENKKSGSITKLKAADCFIKSINLDAEKKYFDLNNKLLDYISTFYYNDAVRILQKFDLKNQDNAISYYDSFKKLKGIAHEDYDFSEKDLDFYYGIGNLYKMR